MGDSHTLMCPYCMQWVDVWVEADQPAGDYVEDCSVCCRPWRVVVTRDDDGTAEVHIERDDG